MKNIHKDRITQSNLYNSTILIYLLDRFQSSIDRDLLLWKPWF